MVEDLNPRRELKVYGNSMVPYTVVSCCQFALGFCTIWVVFGVGCWFVRWGAVFKVAGIAVGGCFRWGMWLLG